MAAPENSHPEDAYPELPPVPDSSEATRLDIFEFWSLCLGQAHTLEGEALDRAIATFQEIKRRFPDSKDEAEATENLIGRTIESTMYVLELCGSAPGRQNLQRHWERFEPLSEALQEIPSENPIPESPDKNRIIKLAQMDESEIHKLSDDLLDFEISLYLHERIVEKVTEAVLLQRSCSYSDLETIRRSTGHFIGRPIPVSQKYAPGRFTPMACLIQLRLLEAKQVLGAEPIRRAEEVFRIIIAQQEGIDLPEPPAQLTSVE